MAQSRRPQTSPGSRAEEIVIDIPSSDSETWSQYSPTIRNLCLSLIDIARSSQSNAQGSSSARTHHCSGIADDGEYYTHSLCSSMDALDEVPGTNIDAEILVVGYESGSNLIDEIQRAAENLEDLLDVPNRHIFIGFSGTHNRLLLWLHMLLIRGMSPRARAVFEYLMHLTYIRYCRHRVQAAIRR